jgi:hypothetical protein
MNYPLTKGLLVRKIKNLPGSWYIYKIYTELKLKHRLTPKKQEAENVFLDIYKNNDWNNSESISGQGSTLIHTNVLIARLPFFLKSHGIFTILDAPCGDFNWMQKVDKTGLKYIGGDIVQELIDKNNKKYKSENVEFIKLNIITDQLPKVDLILVRDCLVHFNYESINNFFENLVKSEIKFILTTNFPITNYNYNITMGNHRLINFKKKPFYFPQEIDVLWEDSTEDYGQCPDKSLFLWKVSDIKKLING